MKGLKRNLIYWGRTLEKQTLLMLLWILLMWCMLTVMEGGSFTKEAVKELSWYLVMLIFFSVFMNALQSITNFFPFTISMGSTRKSSFIAMQTVQYLILAQNVILVGAIYYVIRHDFFLLLREFIFAIIGAILLLEAMVNIACLFCVKFGNVAGVIAYIIIMVMIFAIVLIGGVGGDNGEFINTALAFCRKPYLLGIGAVLDIVIIGIYYTIVKKSNLRLS